MLFSVKSLSRAKSVREDAKNTKSEPRMGSTRYKVHVEHDVRNLMTTDWSQNFRGPNGDMSIKILCEKFVAEYSSGSLLFHVLWRFGASSSLTSRSRLQIISKAFAVLQALKGAKNSFSQTGDRAKIRNATVPTSSLDFLKALHQRGRACGNSSRRADGVNTHQIRTKTTHGANSKKVRKYSIVRNCSCALKGMGISINGRFIRCACGISINGRFIRCACETKKLSTEIALILKSHSRSTKLSVESLIFITRWTNFPGVPYNDECSHPGRSWSRRIWRI